MQSVQVEKNELYSFRMTSRDENINDVVVSECIVWFDDNGMHFGPPL